MMSESPLPLSEDSLNNLSERLAAVVKNLRGNPEVAYVIGSIKKGLAGVDLTSLTPEDRQVLLQKIKRLLEQSPTVLRALAEYRG